MEHRTFVIAALGPLWKPASVIGPQALPVLSAQAGGAGRRLGRRLGDQPAPCSFWLMEVEMIQKHVDLISGRHVG